jgi:Ca2+:H+ antiporter
MYLLFQLKSHAYMYQSTPQHIIDEESAPGPVAQWMESSDDSSSSSSDSDSDGSSGSNTTAKRVKRLMRGGRRRRKSSAGSKDTADADTRPPSLGTSSISPGNTDVLTEEPQTMGIASQHHDFAEDADDEHKSRSRRNSHGSLIFSKKERKRDKERKRQEKKERKRAMRNGGTITEGVVDHATNEKTKALGDHNAPRRVDFAVVDEAELQAEDSPQKRARTLRGLNLRPQMPKTFSQNVFTQPAPTPSPAPPASPIPLVRYGIRRTNSLPDRLNQIMFGPARAGSAGVQPPHVNSLPPTEVPATNADDENISRTTAVFLLLISTGLVAVCAEFMVDSINAVVEEQQGLSETFIGLIILPIVGNAAEHVTAVTVATKNKMDLAIGVAVGSSIQIALFVTPFIVLLGWCMGKEMSLYFTLFETVSLFVSAFIVNFLVLDGRSNYLEGALLCSAYVIIAVAAFFYPNEDEQSNLGGNAVASSTMIRSLVGGVIGI